MKFLKYSYFSNLKVSIDLNPFCWSFKWFHQSPTNIDPKLNIFYLRILPLSITLIIDDGSYVIEDLEFKEEDIYLQDRKDKEYM